tara:strand:- start:2479 stop:3792 length:1314 start_codon:yes stop_codon:yes gene_type:complete
MSDSTSSSERTLRDRLALFRRTQASDIIKSGLPAGLRLGGAFLQLLATVLIARALGVEKAGVYFFWVAAIVEAGRVATFGLDSLSVQQLPRLKNDPVKISAFLAPIRAIVSGIAVLLGLSLCLYAVWTGSDYPSWWYFLPVAGVVGIAIGLINGESMTGLGHPVLSIFYRHTLPTLFLIISVIVAGDRLTPNIALAAYSIGFLVVGFGVLFGPRLRELRPRLRIPRGVDLRENLKLGFPIWLSSLFTALAFIIPLVILERTQPSSEMAYFTTALRILVLFMVLATAVYSLTMPDLSRAAHEFDRKKMKSIYRSATWQGLALLGLPSLLVIGLAEPIMVVFGEDFAAGAPTLRILIGFGVLSLAMGPAHQLLLMVGRTRQMALFSLIHLFVAAILAFLIVPTYGPEGLAGVLGFGLLLDKILYLWYAVRVTNNVSKEA